MKRIILAAFVLYCTAPSLNAQSEYKQNFLLAFSKQPEINDCEAAYFFLCCKNDVCAAFNAAEASLNKSYEELAAMQMTAGNAVMPSSGSAMTAEDGKKLAEKLKNMTKEEKQQWAMQNAQNFMPSAAAHVNKDIDNTLVTEAVQCVTDQQAKDFKNINSLTEFSAQSSTIEKKYAPKKEEALKIFRAVSGTTYDPSSSLMYAAGEFSDQEAARFDKAVEEYKRVVLPIYNSEMKEKLNCILQTEKHLVSTYTPVEEKIALTQYADDAQEPVNKLHLIMGHSGVLQKVRTTMEIFEHILSDYADHYAALMKIQSVKEVNKKEK